MPTSASIRELASSALPIAVRWAGWRPPTRDGTDSVKRPPIFSEVQHGGAVEHREVTTSPVALLQFVHHRQGRLVHTIVVLREGAELEHLHASS